MAVAVKELDAMPPDQARGLLAECCASSKWVNEMVARRPFESRDDVYSAAEEIADSLGRDDWLDAFAHHPRIGEQKGAKAQGERGSTWSANEQSGIAGANEALLEELVDANRAYERRFGYIYIVCASGKTAEEMLKLARERLGNNLEEELRVAAGEQRKITRLRLGKLFESENEAKR
jgi:2-oxo-4-hydroxy-4-carboxy-5-ureidoimidazoline decarboxylase